MNTPGLPPTNAPDAGVRRLLTRRAFWHTLGLVVALALAWLAFRAYRQPELMLNVLSVLC
ncbi:MAG: hypothetical protein IT518_00230 [Burkholderiales bacterium]|nr:hypothetical protein [Burkholderiales bacterium]